MSAPAGTARARIAAAATAAALAALAGCSSDTPAASDAFDQRQEQDQAELAAAPQVVWRQWRGIDLPFSTEGEGPREQYSAAPSRYDRSPHGALIAALQAQARITAATDSEWAQVVGALVAPGPGRDKFAAARVLVSVTGDSDPAASPKWAAYKWDSYSDERAEVTAVVRNPDGSLAAKELAVRWQASTGPEEGGGDWRLELPADPQPPAPLASLDGYTEFAAGV